MLFPPGETSGPREADGWAKPVVDIASSAAGAVVNGVNRVERVTSSVADAVLPTAAARQNAWRDPAALDAEVKAVADDIAAVQRIFDSIKRR